MKWMVLFLFLIFTPFAMAAAPSLDSIITPQNLTEGKSFSYDVNATDPEGGPLYFSDDSGYFNIDESTGFFSFSPTEAMIGSFVAVIIVRDNESLIDAQAIEFVVNGLPDIDEIDNQTINEGDIFYYDVNATDFEDGTTIIYSDNSSLFDINSLSGIINFTSNYSLVGEYLINISAKDTAGESSTEIFGLVINDFVNISLIPNGSATEDILFELNITSYINNSVGTLTFEDNSSLFDINSTTGIISFTPVLAQVGLYSINLNVSDSYGTSDYQNWYLNISQANDAPSFEEINNQTAYIGSNFSLSINATDEENNTIYYYDNSSLFNIEESTGEINYYVNSSMLGNYSINITVNDSLGAEYSDTFNLKVVENIPPVFPRNITKSINPNFDSYVDLEYNSTSYQGSDSLYLSDVSEEIKRSYLNFSLSIIPDIANLVDSNLNLTINAAAFGERVSIFMVNSTFNKTNLTYLTQPNISSVLYNLSSGNNDAIDSFNVSNTVKSWFNGSELNYGFSIRMQNESVDSNVIRYYSSDSSNNNNWPHLYVTYNSNIANRSVAVGNSLTSIFDLDDYFYDSDGSALAYNVSSTSYSTVAIGAGNIVSITAGSSAGTDNVIFSATDGIDTTNSNNVVITVSAGGGSNTGSSSSSSSGGGGGTTQQTASLNIIFDEDRETIEEGVVIQLPVTLENSGDVNIRNIALELSSDELGLDLRLSESIVTSLSVGDSHDLTVIIDSTGASAGSYVISLNADTNYPVLSESAVFVLDVGGVGEALEKNLVMVQDLFQNNPECMELQELVDKAETQLDAQQYEKAKTNIALAIEGCKNMVRIQNEPLKSKGNYSTLISALAILAILTVLIISFYSLFMKSKFSKKKKKR
jgi:hypothetical protein